MAAAGSYWSVQECCWVASPGAPDALATPWSRTGVPVPRPLPPVRDLHDVLGWFPPLPGLPQPRPTPAPEGVPQQT